MANVKQKEPKAEAAPEVKTAPKAATTPEARGRLKKKYYDTLIAELKKECNFKNINEVPRLEKIVLNMGLGDVKDNSKSFNQAVAEMAQISGQKPLVTKARKSVANFKVRENMNVGAKVTLRGERMYEFFDKLVNIVLPRVRDFRGILPSSFDGRGNFAFGVKEQLIFPEIVYDQVEKIRGMDICIVTTAKTDEHALALLTKLGMPFKR